jgi:hypothetical protein
MGRTEVILKDEMLEIRNVDGSLHIARKVKNHDEWDPPLQVHGGWLVGSTITRWWSTMA